MKHLNDIDKIFKDALDGRREPVPSDIWKAVDESINNKGGVTARNHTGFKSFIKLLGILIISSTLFVVYLSLTTKKITIKHTDPLATSPHAKSFNKIYPLDTSLQQLSKENLKSPVGGNINAWPGENKHTVTELRSYTKSFRQYDTVNLSGIHQKVNYSSATILPNGSDPLRQSATNNKNYVNRKSLRIREQNRSSYRKKNHSANGNETISHLIDDKSNGSLKWLSNSFNKLDSNVKKVQSDAPEKSALLASVSQQSIQRSTFELKLNDIHVPFIDANNYFNTLKKASVKLQPIHSISILPFGSLNFSYRHLVDGKRQGGRGLDKDDVKKSEGHGSSFSAGILVNYGLNNDFFIQSGLVFSNVETNIKAGKLYARGDNNGRTRYVLTSSSGYSYLSSRAGNVLTPGDSITINASSSVISYIGLPVSINYAWQRDRFVLNPEAGLSVNFLTQSRSLINIGTSSNQYTEKTSITGLKKVYLDGLFGIGIQYKITPGLSLQLRPLVRLGLTTINDETPVRTFQNYLNLETGLKIKL